MFNPYVRAVTVTLLFLFALRVSLSFGQEGHPLYISICEIEYNRDTRALEIAFKLFTEDVELAVEEQGGGALRLGTADEKEGADDYISRYIRNNVVLELETERVEMQFLGKEVEMDVTWCYMEVPSVTSPGTLTVTNSLFFDLYNEQTNIVHVKVGKDSKSLMLNSNERKGSVTF
ncbi:MAG: hypothetical protein HOH43_09355 [Candidatus Latescibacteria bacterium]|jgi:hypothetical protein|nr:hypothetical protein [Candidatus Latescibacterota bacterium]